MQIDERARQFRFQTIDILGYDELKGGLHQLQPAMNGCGLCFLNGGKAARC